MVFLFYAGAIFEANHFKGSYRKYLLGKGIPKNRSSYEDSNPKILAWKGVANNLIYSLETILRTIRMKERNLGIPHIMIQSTLLLQLL